MTYRWDTPIRYARGLGPTRSRELTKIGIHTVGDLLERKPLSWIYPGTTDIADAKEGMVVIKAKVERIEEGRGYTPTVEATVSDDTGVCDIRWYGNPHFSLQNLRPGMLVTFWGKMKGGTIQQPRWTCVPKTMENVYGGVYGVHHDTIRAALKEVLANVELPDTWNDHSRAAAYQVFHFPDSEKQQQRCLKDLKFDEALTLQLALAEKRKEREGVAVEPIPIDNIGLELCGYFPYNFTDDQNDAITAVLNDMCVSDYPMQRLIHGEVGSGKTAVAFYVAMLAALNGKRTLILCPTSILAFQHYDTLKGMGWDDMMLWENTRPCSIGGVLGPPLAHVIIGTHALLNQPKLIESTSLVVIDEMQKFGVEQRAQATKHNPHLLLLSATPIPRSLAATVFGDLDVSVIRELPIKRGTIVTRWVLPGKREAMYEIIERELAKGHQAYIVYPKISGDEDVVSAERGHELLRKRFGFHRVGLLTGKNKPEHKATILRSFKGKAIDILVSTIIAEVGLDNPNATVMVVEGADRFGLSQLHQLRGRVCRSTDTAFCFLVSETSNPTSIARLEVIEKTNDGFEIAEHDLRLRGAGEVFSTRQHGLPDLRWCSLVDDYDLMIKAKELVASGNVGDGVREMMVLKYGESLELGGVV